jgi:hypothetical protein
MSQTVFKEKHEAEKPRAEARRLWWIIGVGLVVVGVTVAVISPKCLLLVLLIACLILYSRLPYRLRGMLFTTLFSRDLSKRKRHDDDT